MAKNELQRLSSTQLEETKKYVLENVFSQNDPNALLKAVSDTLDDCYEDRGKSYERLLDTLEKALLVVGLDSHTHLAYCVDKNFQPLVIQFARDLAEEYQCTKPSEKVLVDNIALAYGRTIHYAYMLKMGSSPKNVNKVSNQYNSVISKELDRANRHFIIGMTLLKQMKSPPVNVKIQSKNAFVSGKQEFNQYNDKL